MQSSGGSFIAKISSNGAYVWAHNTYDQCFEPTDLVLHDNDSILLLQGCGIYTKKLSVAKYSISGEILAGPNVISSYFDVNPNIPLEQKS